MEEATARTLTTTIVERVADREDAEPVALHPPLHDAIDPDALTALFATPDNGVHHVKFVYHGYEIVVEGPGRVQVESLADAQA